MIRLVRGRASSFDWSGSSTRRRQGCFEWGLGRRRRAGDKATTPRESLAPRCEPLGPWLAHRGAALEHTPRMLNVVEDLLDEWAGDEQIGPQLGNEVGLFVGSVVVKAVSGARWHG